MLKQIVMFCVSVLLFLSVASAHGQETTKAMRRSPQPQVRYALGPDSLPQDGVPKGTLEGPFLFHSKIIENTVRKYWIHVPAQYNAEQPACVLVFQDGARAINPDGVIRVPQVLDNLIAKKQIPVTIGIFITPGQRGDEFPDSIGTGNPDNRDREYDVLDDKYARFIVEEMLPEVGEKYNLTKDSVGRAIGGSSSGGICAFTVAWHMPHEFRNVVSFIGSFTNIHGGHVYPQLVRDAAKKNIRIFLQDGVNDLRSPNNLERDWHIQNQKMLAALNEKGYNAAHVFGEGGHSDDHGGVMLPEMLRWIWRDYPGIAKPEIDLVAKAAAIKPVQVDLFPGLDANANVDPSGVWTWERRGRTRTQTSLTLKKSDEKWTGSYETARGEQQPNSQDISDVTLEGNKITFAVERRFNDRAFVTTYQGVVHADKIVGWSMTEFNGTQRDRTWTAMRKRSARRLRRQMGSDDQRREWKYHHIAVDSARETPTSWKAPTTASFFGEAKAENIRWEDGSLKFDVTFSRDGNDFTFTYSGKLDDGELTGSIASEFQGQKRETPFTAKREK